MKSDISEQIKEILTSTIETAFGDGSNITIENSYKVTKDYLSDIEVVTVKIGFTFEKLDTKLQIIIPAKTATKIAFAMLMEDTPPIDTINSDIADAMKESIGQICGSLQTSLNSSAYEDLGKTTFLIGDIEIIEGKTYEQIGSLIDLKLLIGEDLFDYFIDFDETFTPFIEELQNSPILEIAQKEEEIPPLDEESGENSESSEADEEVLQTEENIPQVDSIPTQNDEVNEPQEIGQTIKEDENIDEGTPKQEDLPVDKKAKRLKIAIIALGVTIALIVVTFVALLFMGTFDKEELPLDKNGTKEANQTVQTDESLVLMEIQNKQIDFKIDMIDVNRLNEKLKYLTKYEILEEDALAKYTQEEEERLYKIRMEKLEQFALNNREESLVPLTNQNQTQELGGEKPINRFDEELDRNISEQNTTNIEFTKQLEATPLVFIKVDPKLYKKYKPTIDANRDELIQVSICKSENGKVDVYIGPMYVKSVLNDIINEAKKVDTNSKRELIITSMKREQFNKICDL